MREGTIKADTFVSYDKKKKYERWKQGIYLVKNTNMNISNKIAVEIFIKAVY